MTAAYIPHTLGVIEARERLPQILDDFRHGSRTPVFIGARRRTEAVIIPVDSFEENFASRTKAAASALGSIRAEGGNPTSAAAAILERWTQGEISNEQMKQQIYALHGVK
jgi:hypothetical protein